MLNWAGNYQYKASRIHCPKTVEEVQAIVQKAKNVRALGSRHCFNDIADCPDADLISMAEMNRVIHIDKEKLNVTIQGGVTYGQLCPELNKIGLSVHNLASLPHISVAGACMTATHGSGNRNRCLSSIVIGMKIVGAEGEVKEYSRDRNSDIFPGMVVSLGSLGIVVELTLKLESAFSIRQTVFRDLPIEQFKLNFDAITSSAYSVSSFTNWKDPKINQVWLKQREGETIKYGADFFGARPATVPLHPLEGVPADYCTEQLGIEGPWHLRLPHFKLEFTPSNGVELQSEYLIPRTNAIPAIQAIHELREKISPHLQVCEIRTMAADDLWMSPFYQQDCIGIHFTWKQDWQNVSKVLPEIEKSLLPLGAKPHWGKLFVTSASDLQKAYGDQFLRFSQLLKQHDPDGKFRNPYMDRYFSHG